MAKRRVEVFTAGCGLCDEAVERVRALVCESCDLQVHDLNTEAGIARARQYGVVRAPSVVVNGQLAGCCAQRSIDEGVLRGLGVGAR